VRTSLTGTDSYCYKWMLHILQVSTSLSIWHHYNLNEFLAKLFWRLFCKFDAYLFSMLWKQNSFFLLFQTFFNLKTELIIIIFLYVINVDILRILVLLFTAEQIVFPLCYLSLFFYSRTNHFPSYVFMESRIFCYVVLFVIVHRHNEAAFSFKNNIILT